MHDIWNPWHGCVKVSEGCKNCYMYALDKARGQDGRRIYRTADRTIPIHRDRRGNFKYRPGEFIRVCMTSDFFLEDADAWREEAWAVMRERRDLKFYLLTKRAERIARCLPADWGDGWENVMLSVTAENQKRADERLPQLLVVIQNAIMSESKGNACRTHERVIVAVLLLVALGGHAGVTHDTADVLRQAVAHQVSGPRAFIHRQMSVAVVSYPGGVCAPCLAGGGQCGDQAALLSGSQAALIIANSKQAAHLYFPLSFYRFIYI